MWQYPFSHSAPGSYIHVHVAGTMAPGHNYYVNISIVIYGKEFDVTKIEVCKNKATIDMLHVLNHARTCKHEAAIYVTMKAPPLSQTNPPVQLSLDR